MPLDSVFFALREKAVRNRRLKLYQCNTATRVPAREPVQPDLHTLIHGDSYTEQVHMPDTVTHNCVHLYILVINEHTCVCILGVAMGDRL